MFELYRAGVLTSFNSVWHYRHYVYRVVNNYIAKLRKRTILNSSLVQMINLSDKGESGTEEYLPIPVYEKGFSKTEVLEIHKRIVETFPFVFSSRCNVENYIRFYELHFIGGFTLEECAVRLDKSVSTLAGWKGNILGKLHKPQVYEALHSAIYDDAVAK